MAPTECGLCLRTLTTRGSEVPESCSECLQPVEAYFCRFCLWKFKADGRKLPCYFCDYIAELEEVVEKKEGGSNLSIFLANQKKFRRGLKSYNGKHRPSSRTLIDPRNTRKAIISRKV